MNNADLLEECLENVVLQWEQFMFDHPEHSSLKTQAVREFIEYCYKQTQYDLDVIRANGLSFRQQREKEKLYEVYFNPNIIYLFNYCVFCS